MIHQFKPRKSAARDTDQHMHPGPSQRDESASTGGTTDALWPEYLSVKEAARLLGVSERSIYGYLESGRLASTQQGNLLGIETAALRCFHRAVAGRPRTRQPEWHRSSADNAQVLMTVRVQIRAGQRQALEQCLEQLRLGNRHALPGTIARYIAREPGAEERVCFMFVWRKVTMPPQEKRAAAFAALRDELAEIVDWETMSVQECEMLLHT